MPLSITTLFVATAVQKGSQLLNHSFSPLYLKILDAHIAQFKKDKHYQTLIFDLKKSFQTTIDTSNPSEQTLTKLKAALMLTVPEEIMEAWIDIHLEEIKYYAHMMGRKLLIRTTLIQAIERHGFQQVFIPAAGLSPLGLELAFRYPKVHFWEVDLDEVVDIRKKSEPEVKAILQSNIPPNLHLASGDLTLNGWQKLKNFDPHKKTIVPIEGFTMYLSFQQVTDFFQTLQRMLSPESRVLTSFNLPDAHKTNADENTLLKKNNEQFKAGFFPQEALNFVVQSGFNPTHWAPKTKLLGLFGLEHLVPYPYEPGHRAENFYWLKPGNVGFVPHIENLPLMNELADTRLTISQGGKQSNAQVATQQQNRFSLSRSNLSIHRAILSEAEDQDNNFQVSTPTH